jgi:hypothetical protein
MSSLDSFVDNLLKSLPRKPSKGEVLAALNSRKHDLVDCIMEKAETIIAEEECAEESANLLHSKFTTCDGIFEGKFGDIADFLKGLDSFIGLPNANVENAIRVEHMYSRDSKVPFELNGVQYSPQQEYEFVVNPLVTTTYPKTEGPRCREIHPLDNFLQSEKCTAAKLLREEVIALRLYTGPMYYKYNTVLRKFPVDAFAGLQGNSYTTTLHAIVSGIIKLSHIMVLPPSRKVNSSVMYIM